MKKLRRILVAIADLQHVSGGALRRAATLAHATGARVELFHVVTEAHRESRRSGGRLRDLQRTPAQSTAAAEKVLQRIARSKLLAGVRVLTAAVWDKPAYEAVIRRASESGADLIISGTHSRGLANRLLLRHTDWELVRHAPIPVLLVKSARQARKAVVLAAIDPLHANAKPARLDARILDAANGMAALLKGKVHAFHAYLPMSVALAAGFGEPLIWDSTEADAYHTRQVVREFNRALRTTALPPARRHLRIGDAAGELQEVARRIRATLVVMGAVSRSGLDRLFIGNTAERVLDALACDVLVIKPNGFKSPVRR
ncbi:MAG TPA: universal stress protein [Steroidobacteraceae bacterium]|nr:universal stress protein [Steroidobacteraceae bacterium]